MRRILFVRGFFPTTRARDLAHEFERYGPLVRCDVPAPRNPHASHSPYAFVEFRSNRDAEDAYHEMDGRQFEGARLSVEWAKNPPSSVWRFDRRTSPPHRSSRSDRDRDRSRSPRRNDRDRDRYTDEKRDRFVDDRESRRGDRYADDRDRRDRGDRDRERDRYPDDSRDRRDRERYDDRGDRGRGRGERERRRSSRSPPLASVNGDRYAERPAERRRSLSPTDRRDRARTPPPPPMAMAMAADIRDSRDGRGDRAVTPTGYAH
ncbi:hypothetical protein E1B28_013608 [Marasmius oreades]|uniref:RRM domain-containing protein n=1 Tax=Marasmius oreades TaxID=181124 RepID=A0A9P7RQ71_9AGAR|nr:uncharacterized protein E1B28_013608 [Marasmius oreades]KAG7087660.1 hypothetical protein E1B28_013608 [Marasmius oreades]